MPRLKVSAAWLLALAWIVLLVLIWWKGPAWRLYGEHWLKPLANRWLATAVWGLLALVWLTVRVVKRLQQIESQQKQQRQEEQDPLTVAVNRQQRYLDRWLLRLQRHLDSRRYLWELPWYVVTGLAGSGKTALLREGFPADVIYTPDAVRGVEQRAYITPYVGRQAVVFDIDGALTEQDDSDILHRRLREHWLNWLVQKRTRQPLNGLILTLDLPDLLTADKQRHEQLVQLLRTRLQEVRQSLHTRFPVYVVLTKLDLLTGFATWFRTLDRRDRDRILGVTFTRNAHESDAWRTELRAFWQAWGQQMNLALIDQMLTQSSAQRSAAFSFSRQMQGAGEVILSEKLDDKARAEAQAEPEWKLLNRLGHEFAPENSTLEEQKDKGSTLQAVYQQLTELHRYLLAIQNAPVPGKSALKAVQLRLDQNSSDPIFTTRQMAKTLPAPLNRWVEKLAEQAWHVVMIEAVHYMELDWRDNVVKTFNSQLADKYPFNPRAKDDASLDAFERFFKPGGVLDTFYQQNLKLFVENSQGLSGEDNVIIREDILSQLATAQKIRDIFFSQQNGLGAQFAVETVSLSGNKRRSVLNLDGQLVDYAQGRNYTAHLVWPNNMREGNESKLTLIGAGGNAPRSITFSGPWAQFRLFGAGQLTSVQDGTFSARFSVDGGTMTYRVHTDTEDNPFAGGLFSQFRLADTLY
ncbi:TPA: hypothetical protein O8U43_001620 [Enterobacter cloacae]|nr:hypothetical protein [Enterobacter cloacae]